ncbi:hypothetical protein [Microvirga lotononidis]|uniref:hypothetical protein n=1 Tax=Microvirga lotononidis TaxID=864069 RepID=UPI00031F3233|nr:hypothetical protein [Microvirga lotononidis]WQO26744.1 hypothetical protein U0023_19065 [Microvirga lotononidis]
MKRGASQIGMAGTTPAMAQRLIVEPLPALRAPGMTPRHGQDLPHHVITGLVPVIPMD